MNKLIELFLVIFFLSLTASTVSSEESGNLSSMKNETFPMPNWPVLLGKPLKTEVTGNKQVDIYASKHFRNAQSLDYAWASLATLDDQCMVIIWIHGDSKSKRIQYKAKKGNNFCTVYIDREEFEKNFKYCVLSGVKVDDAARKINVSFSGGPAGDREKYWFEWGDPSYVHPNFYCILK